MAETTQEWVQQVYQTLPDLRSVRVPDLTAGPEELRVTMGEIRRRMEAVTLLIGEATQRRSHAKSVVRAARAKTLLLRRSEDHAEAQAQLDDAIRAVDDLSAVIVTLRGYLDIHRATAQDARSLAKLMSDGLRASHPGSDAVPGPLPQTARQRPREPEPKPEKPRPSTPMVDEGPFDMEELLGR